MVVLDGLFRRVWAVMGAIRGGLRSGEESVAGAVMVPVSVMTAMLVGRAHSRESPEVRDSSRGGWWQPSARSALFDRVSSSPVVGVMVSRLALQAHYMGTRMEVASRMTPESVRRRKLVRLFRVCVTGFVMV